MVCLIGGNTAAIGSTSGVGNAHEEQEAAGEAHQIIMIQDPEDQCGDAHDGSENPGCMPIIRQYFFHAVKFCFPGHSMHRH